MCAGRTIGCCGIGWRCLVAAPGGRERRGWSVKKAWIWGARGEWDALMTPLLWLHSAGTWQQQRSEVLGLRSGTNRCPEDEHVRDTPRGWATGPAHRHRPHTIGESARRRRYGAARAGWGDVHH